MEVIRSIQALRDSLRPTRGPGARLGFVPTMGALHEGHARLIERARHDCSTVAVSIFVNPLQFDRAADLEHYPRTLDADLEICRSIGVDVVFAPDAKEMYPQPPMCVVEVGSIADTLCGRHRPGHFRGVATVVTKLFQIVQPDRSYFGEKDAQQLAIIRRLVLDLNIPTEIVGVATVREPDGLALSSRNRHLTATERRLAPSLYHAIREAGRLIAAGTTDVTQVVAAAAARIPTDAALTLEYLEVVDPDDLRAVEHVAGPVLVAGALWAGSTRLIDNMLCVPPR